MSSDCQGLYRLKVQDSVRAAKAVVASLRELGYRAYRRGAERGRFKIEGVRGNSFVAVLASLPILSWTGFGSRVKIEVRGGKSLTEGEDDFISVRVYPIREIEQERERGVSGPWATQSYGERHGDNLQASRCFESVVDALRGNGLIQENP